ncbi:MAG TPA: ComF family protein [Chthoniobacterales bacterium]|nr:ComF family protein [Chthoniobacterales bacterium]
MPLAKINPFPALVSLFYPAVCAGCGTDVDSRDRICGECESKLARIVPPFCAKCSEPFSGAVTSAFECANCAHRELYFDAAVSGFRSRGIIRKVILDFKYGRQAHLRHVVAGWLFATMEDDRIRTRQFDLIVPVPLHPARQRERGFNQAALLAELLSHKTSIRREAVLERVRYTTSQTAFDRAERMENLHGAFRLRKNSDVRKLRVLLVDDVLTTGSTLSECARVLKNAGAVSVHAVTAARA